MIYYAEDDRGIRDLVIYTLQNTGFEAMGFETGEALLDAVKQKAPALILLDIMLPGVDGITVLKRLRSASSTFAIPVIMVSAKGTEYDKVIGLDLGADDYLSKPFGMMELISRIKAVMRRATDKDNNAAITVADIQLDPRAHSVAVGGQIVELTLKEFELLRLLMTNIGVVLTRDRLLETVWGYDFDGETRTVDVHIRSLRQKLGDKGDCIETVRGVGYKIGGRS